MYHVGEEYSFWEYLIQVYLGPMSLFAVLQISMLILSAWFLLVLEKNTLSDNTPNINDMQKSIQNGDKIYYNICKQSVTYRYRHTHTHIHQHTKQVMRRNWGLGWGRPSGLTAFWCGGAFTRRKFVVSSGFGGASWQKPQPQARLVEVWMSIKRFLELLTSSSSRRALEEHLKKATTVATSSRSSRRALSLAARVSLETESTESRAPHGFWECWIGLLRRF